MNRIPNGILPLVNTRHWWFLINHSHFCVSLMTIIRTVKTLTNSKQLYAIFLKVNLIYQLKINFEKNTFKTIQVNMCIFWQISCYSFFLWQTGFSLNLQTFFLSSSPLNHHHRGLLSFFHQGTLFDVRQASLMRVRPHCEKLSSYFWLLHTVK